MFKVIEEKIAVPLMIILTFFVLGGIFWSVQQTDRELNNAVQQPYVKKANVKDEFKDWRTYRNEEFGFEFKYPEKIEPVSYSYNGNSFECFAEKQGNRRLYYTNI